ncbi:hypothetical protein V6R90_19140 [Nocardioides kribbensis]|uniref:Uncharacterized protein n=2 Tax=Nocardioides kribbensis TaxID=305517 RepID=A0ABV1P3R9_9ACTN
MTLVAHDDSLRTDGLWRAMAVEVLGSTQVTCAVSLLDQPVQLDGALAAFTRGTGHLLDGVLDPDVEEERPLAVLADLDQLRLQGVVLVVGDLVATDRVVNRLEHLAGKKADAFRRRVGADLLVAGEALGGVGAGCGGGCGLVDARWWFPSGG